MRPQTAIVAIPKATHVAWRWTSWRAASRCLSKGRSPTRSRRCASSAPLPNTRVCLCWFSITGTTLPSSATHEIIGAPWNWDLAAGATTHYPNQWVDTHFINDTEASLTLPTLEFWTYLERCGCRPLSSKAASYSCAWGKMSYTRYASRCSGVAPMDGGQPGRIDQPSQI